MINNFFKNYNIKLEASQAYCFEKFLNLFIEQNAKLNLSAIRDAQWIIEKHFIDSIMLDNFIELHWKVLDIWTWWWFPWIPLAIMNKEYSFTLIDSTRKKIESVNHFCWELWLRNCIWIWWRAEELAKKEELKWQFDFIVSRATAYLPQILDWSYPFLKKWWKMIFYKLYRDEELEDWLKKAKKLWISKYDVKKYILWWQERVFYLFN